MYPKREIPLSRAGSLFLFCRIIYIPHASSVLEFSNMNTEMISTQQAAKSLGMSRDALLQWLYRNPEYKPSFALGPAYGWTGSEIEAVREKRIELKKRPQRKAIQEA